MDSLVDIHSKAQSHRALRGEERQSKSLEHTVVTDYYTDKFKRASRHRDTLGFSKGWRRQTLIYLVRAWQEANTDRSHRMIGQRHPFHHLLIQVIRSPVRWGPRLFLLSTPLF